MRTIKPILSSFILGFLIFGLVLAQETCTALVQTAIETASTNCDDLRRNQACYGNVTIDAEAVPSATNFTFDTAGDVVNVADIQSLRLSSLVEDGGDWGIATMYVQANLPDTSESNVQIVLFGNVAIDNTGMIDDIQLAEAPLTFEQTSNQPSDTPDEPTPTPSPSPSPTPEPLRLTLTSTGNLNVRSGPNTTFAVIRSLSAGQDVTATSRNTAGDWVSIDFDGQTGWVYVPLMTVEGDVLLLDIAEDTTVATVATTTTDETTTTEETQLIPIALEPNTIVEGSVTLNDTYRIYTVFAQAGTRIRVRAESLDGLQDFSLRIVDANDEFIAYNDDSDGTLNPYISGAEITTTGEYYVVVSLRQRQLFEGTTGYRLIMDEIAPPEFGTTQGLIINTTDDLPCGDDIDSGVLIQTPEGEGEITIVLNEVTLRLGSTAYIRTNESAVIAGVLEGKGIVSSEESRSEIPEGAEIIIPLNASSADVFDQTNLQPYDDETFNVLPLESLDRQITPAPPWTGIVSGQWLVTYPVETVECIGNTSTSPGRSYACYDNGPRVPCLDDVTFRDGIIRMGRFSWMSGLKAISDGDATYYGYGYSNTDQGTIESSLVLQVESPTQVNGTLDVTTVNDSGTCPTTNSFTMTYQSEEE